MPDVMTSNNQEQTKQVPVERIVGFAEEFGEAHLDLACHAAFPLILTPDLLYQIWAHFLPETPWIAVARVLLSRLCRQVGYEMYEMDIPVRNLLLRELKEQFEQKRMEELAGFLMYYVQQRLTQYNPDTQDLREAQEWTALAYTQPNEAARKLAQALSERVKQKDMPQVLRLTSLAETFAEPLAEQGFMPLLIYSNAMSTFIRGDQQGAVSQLRELPTEDNSIKVAGVTLPLPEWSLPNNIQREETQDLSIGERLRHASAGIVSQFRELTSQFQAKYYENLVYTYRIYRTQGLKTPGAFQPDLEKVFVPLRMASKSPLQMSSALIQKETTGDLQIWDFLAEIRTTHTYRRILIIAPPGYGKTTLLEHLALVYAQNTQRRHHPQAPKLIPVLLDLRKISDKITTSRPPNLAQLVTEVVKTESQESSTKLDPPLQWFDDRLKSGKCLVMLDGLDEVVDINQRQRVSQWVDVQMNAYPGTTFILTSRPYGYQEAQLQHQLFCLEVQPFNLKQMEEFINNWYLQNEVMRQVGKEDLGVRADAKRKANDLIERIKNYPALAAMALNPLLLTMIATVHDNRGVLPVARVELYAEICEVLLARRQQVKGIDYPIPLNAAQKQSVLQVLALQLMQNKTGEFTPDIGEQIIQQQLSAVSGNKVGTNAFFKHIEQVSGLLLEKQQGLYEFAHKSFQEYLAAVEVQEKNNEQILRDNINDSWWDETIRLYAAKNDTTNLIEAALHNPTIVSLSIAYDCLQEGRSVAPQVRQQLEEVLEANLESSNPQLFQIAAEVKLRRQLRHLVRIDEKLEIDNSYITCAEYQLFLDNTGEALQHQHWQNNRFPAGDAKKPITGVSWENANRFCIWLKAWSEKQGLSTPIGELATHYRLLTEEERNQHSINDDKLFAESGIRLVRFKIPSRYNQLAHDLLSGEWRKADEQTYQVMLQVAGRESQGYLDEEAIENFPCDDLRIIDNLWVYASKGHFGFSVQKKIYQELGGTKKYNEKIWNAFGDRVGWRKGGSWLGYESITFDGSAAMGHLPWRPGFQIGVPRIDMGEIIEEVLTTSLWVGLFSRAQACQL